MVPSQPSGKAAKAGRTKCFGVIFILFLFYISGGKNWFLVWSNTFQVVTSLPSSCHSGWSQDGEEEGELWAPALPPYTKPPWGTATAVSTPTLRDTHPPIRALPFWTICLILGRLPHFSEPQSLSDCEMVIELMHVSLFGTMHFSGAQGVT